MLAHAGYPDAVVIDTVVGPFVEDGLPGTPPREAVWWAFRLAGLQRQCWPCWSAEGSASRVCGHDVNADAPATGMAP